MTVKKDQQGLTVQAARPFLSQTLTVGAASVASASFSVGPTNQYSQDSQGGAPIFTPNNTNHVRLVSTTNCWVVFGAAPVAVGSTTPAIYLPSLSPEYFWVFPGEKIAVIQDTAGGILSIAELVN